MLVIAIEPAHYATGVNRIETTWHEAGDIFELKNTDYAFECIKSGLVRLVNPVQQVQDALKLVVNNEAQEKPLPIITTSNTVEVNATAQAIELANELGIDIANVKSKSGKITVLDVRNYQKDSLV